MTRPLEGLKVLDFTHVLAGPFATRVLGDLGADVVKINSQARAIGANDPQNPYYIMWNRNKRALALDMSHAQARQTCRELAEQADIVIDNFSVGVLDRWGVGFDDVSQVNKGVIYVQMSGMGDGGPWSDFVTYAPTIHALAGLTQLTGVEGREDIGIGFSYNDHQAGLHGAVAILAALEARHRTGCGQRIDISQFEVGANFVGPSLMDFMINGHAARPTGNDLPYDKLAPHGCYPCAPNSTAATAQIYDAVAAERWIAIACMSDEQWHSLARLMGDPEWTSTAQYSHATGRYEHRALIDSKIAQWTQNQDAYELMTRCQNAGIPAGVVQNGVDLVERDPQLRASNFLFEFEDVHPEIGPTFADRLPIHFANTPCDQYSRVRALGEDNESVLRDWLGVSEEDFANTQAEGWLQ